MFTFYFMIINSPQLYRLIDILHCRSQFIYYDYLSFYSFLFFFVFLILFSHWSFGFYHSHNHFMSPTMSSIIEPFAAENSPLEATSSLLQSELTAFSP